MDEFLKLAQKLIKREVNSKYSSAGYDDKEDICQEILIDCMDSYSSYDPSKPPEPYINTIIARRIHRQALKVTDPELSFYLHQKRKEYNHLKEQNLSDEEIRATLKVSSSSFDRIKFHGHIYTDIDVDQTPSNYIDDLDYTYEQEND